jgi:hypothetical protein
MLPRLEAIIDQLHEDSDPFSSDASTTPANWSPS